MNESIEQTTFEVTEQHSRLDLFLSRAFEGLSRRQAREYCQLGLVRVNGCKKKPGHLLRVGDRVELERLPEQVRARAELARAAEKEDLLLPPIVFEDEHLLVLNKPSAMPSVTLRKDDPLTVADCLAAYCPQCTSVSKDPREAGLVQRLDYFTSGLLLAAKTPVLWQQLHRLLLAGEIEKTYFALLDGALGRKRFTASHSLVQSSDGKKMEIERADRKVSKRKAFPAETSVTLIGVYQSEKLDESFSLVKAVARRVKRHQIRIHLAESAFPLVGDALYGSSRANCPLVDQEGERLRDGFFLHAESLSFSHPISGERLLLHAVSDYLERLKKQLD